MLDAFIIEKIKREQEEAHNAPALRITPPDPIPNRPLPRGPENREEGTKRGVVEIDFNLDTSVQSNDINYSV